MLTFETTEKLQKLKQMQQSVFSKVKQGASIEVFALVKACIKDISPRKVDLSAGSMWITVIKSLVTYVYILYTMFVYVS